MAIAITYIPTGLTENNIILFRSIRKVPWGQDKIYRELYEIKTGLWSRKNIR